MSSYCFRRKGCPQILLKIQLFSLFFLQFRGMNIKETLLMVDIYVDEADSKEDVELYVWLKHDQRCSSLNFSLLCVNLLCILLACSCFSMAIVPLFS